MSLHIRGIRCISRDIINRFDTFIFDCDGVLWNESKIIPGATDIISKLKNIGKKIFLVTNNSSKSRSQYEVKCQKLGLAVTKEDIVCTASIAANYLKKINFSGKLYILGTHGLSEELAIAGIDHVGVGPDETPNLGNDGFAGYSSVQLDPDIKGVLVGFDPHFSYIKLLRATSYIRKTGVFVATNLDAFLPTPGSDVTIPGTGSLVTAVKYASQMEPVVMGKPSVECFEALRALHPELDPSRTLMVGDRLDTDIRFGRQSQLQTLAVLTGATTRQQLVELVDKSEEDPEGEAAAALPHFVTQSVADLLPLLDC